LDVFIVGGDSAIGAATARRLTAAGLSVAATTRRRESASAERPFLDLSAPSETWNLPRAGVCVLAAARARLADCEADPEGSRLVNATATAEIARRMAANGSLVLLLSTNQVFDGAKAKRAPDDSPAPLTAYGSQKAEAEAAIRALGTSGAILRLTKVLTPDLPLVKGWIERLKANQPIGAFGDMRLAPVLIDRVTEAIELICRAHASGIFQASGDCDLPYLFFARRIAAHCRVDPALVRDESGAAAGVAAELRPQHTTLDTGTLGALGWTAESTDRAIDRYCSEMLGLASMTEAEKQSAGKIAPPRPPLPDPRYRAFLANRQVQGFTRREQNELKRRHRRRVRLMGCLFLPLALLMRLIRPLLLVRVGYVLRHKIGHCPMEAEAYLLEQAAGMQPRRALDLFYFDYGTDGQSANLFAEHLVRRHLFIRGWVEWLAAANSMLPGADRHWITLYFRDRQQFADTEQLLSRFPPQITLNAAERALGRALLARMGVPEDGRFICFHVRSAGYWGTRKQGIKDDSDFRNSSIVHAESAMLAAAERGYYVIRLGAAAAEPLSIRHPRIIDYAREHRSEFMDVYLAAECHLMVSTASGLDTIAYFSRRPIVFVNLSSWGWEYVGLPQPFLCIFKKFWRAGQLMTFAQMLEMGAEEFTVSGQFAEAGITLEENAPDEIQAAVEEMLDRLEGKSAEDAGDRARQARMRDYVRRASRYRDWQFEVSAAYLRKFEALL
jgi:dTDP-4-dehydrorhamnose reductase